MSATWTVLASGSSGNCSVLEVGHSALLVDAGLGPRQIDGRLQAVNKSWNQIRAVLLTHTHSDHWNESTISRLAESRIPFYCHADHVRPLQLECPKLQRVQLVDLVRNYAADRPFEPIPGVRCRAVELKHDGGRTFGFRFDGDESSAAPWSLGYAADLGSWDQKLAMALADVDLLALEFNHDVDLQRNSGRAGWLINRVLGEFGHLSNEQAAQFFEECARRSASGRLRHLIQLHLSRQCNRPALAVAAARASIERLGWDVELHTADQHRPTRCISLASQKHVA